MSVPNDLENSLDCLCRRCLSFDECKKEKMEGLFCSRGKSVCTTERKGCLCADCPIHDYYNLYAGYYCESGKA